MLDGSGEHSQTRGRTQRSPGGEVLTGRNCRAYNFISTAFLHIWSCSTGHSQMSLAGQVCLSALTLGLTISLFFLPSRTLWLPCLPPTRPLVESRRCRLGNMVCLPTSSPFQSQRPHYLWPPRKHPNAFQALLPPCLTRKQTSQKRSIPECGPKWKTSTMLQRRSFLIHYHSITKA